jgi:carboxymethylenebutenolidase
MGSVTVLVQLGLLPEWLPFHFALPDGRVPDPGHHFEYRLPAAGIESAEKFQDIHSMPSNEMINFGIRQVKDN